MSKFLTLLLSVCVVVVVAQEIPVDQNTDAGAPETPTTEVPAQNTSVSRPEIPDFGGELPEEALNYIESMKVDLENIKAEFEGLSVEEAKAKMDEYKAAADAVKADIISKLADENGQVKPKFK